MSSIHVSPVNFGPGLSGSLLSPLEEYPIKDFTRYLALEQMKAIGNGYYADVYKFRALDTFDTIRQGQFYAVKCIRPHMWKSSEAKLKRRLTREISTWASLEHPNLLKLHGAIYTAHNGDPEIPSLVSDLMPYGDAVVYFKTAAPSALVPFIIQIASGLGYLHQNNIAHGDLKTNNVLVKASGEACLGDFGLSRILQIDSEQPMMPSSSDGNHTSPWLAIEYMKADGPKAPTKKGDVWSFGCIALHLFSGKTPFHGVLQAQAIANLFNGHLPEIPSIIEREEFESYRAGIVSLTCLCWIKDPKTRPGIDTVKAFLETYYHLEASTNPLNTLSPESPESKRSAGPSRPTSSMLVDDILAESLSRMSVRSPSRSSTMATVGANGTDTGALGLNREYGQGAASPSSSSSTDSVSAASLFSEEAQSPTATDSETSSEDYDGPKPWKEIPSPPPPSIEMMLKEINKSSVSKLNELFQGQGPMPEFEDESSGPSHNPVHVCVVKVNGIEYGRFEGSGKKKDVRQKAALIALERIRNEEGPGKFRDLTYWPILRKHLRSHGKEIKSKVEDEIATDDDNLPIYTVTFKYEGELLSRGTGHSEEYARDAAARNAFTAWN